MNQDFQAAMSEDELSQVIAAILDGKYSLACALFLRFQGYEPSDYIPYRTYIRLVKERCQQQSLLNKKNSDHKKTQSSNRSGKKTQIRDLSHIETLKDFGSGIVGGGNCFHSCNAHFHQEARITSIFASMKGYYGSHCSVGDR